MSQFIDSSSIANRLWFDFSTFVGCKRLDAKYCPCPLWQHRRLLVLADDSWQIIYNSLSFILVRLWTKSFEDIRGHLEHVSHCFGPFGRLMVKPCSLYCHSVLATHWRKTLFTRRFGVCAGPQSDPAFRFRERSAVISYILDYWNSALLQERMQPLKRESHIHPRAKAWLQPPLSPCSTWFTAASPAAGSLLRLTESDLVPFSSAGVWSGLCSCCLSTVELRHCEGQSWVWQLWFSWVCSIASCNALPDSPALPQLLPLTVACDTVLDYMWHRHLINVCWRWLLLA